MLILKYALGFVFVFCSLQAQSALPPYAQNQRDLDVMVRFIEMHERVISTLQYIDFNNYIVYYGEQCEALFSRDKPDVIGIPGPLEPLRFDRSNCSVEW